jgi:DnaJ-like protein
VDPYEVLGVVPGASIRDVAAAYRRQAKRWHPDRAGAAAQGQMAAVNVAYELLRTELTRQAKRHAKPRNPVRSAEQPGAWLSPAVRRALGPELLAALEHEEQVVLVTPVSTWASPQAVLVLTDRRLLWLLDDAPSHRVRFLRFRDVAAIEQRPQRPLRRAAVLRVLTTAGRRLAFADVRPPTASAIASRVAAALPAG